MTSVPVLRRTVLVVAGLNLAFFVVELVVALRIGSVALVADSVDFLEDTAVNLLVFLALGWSVAGRSRAGRVMALVILAPAAAAAWQAVVKAADPQPPDALALTLTAGGALVVNAVAARLLAAHRRTGGSMGRAAWLAARNDVLVNLAIIAVGVLTWLGGSGWPDLVLGVLIVVVNLRAAHEVWELAGEERLAARALAGEQLD